MSTLCTLTVDFLHYGPCKSTKEITVKIFSDQLENEKSTTVRVHLYSKGFEVQGELNHVSFDKSKSKSKQFVASGLLKEIQKYDYRNHKVLMVIHETVDLKKEVLLFSFTNLKFRDFIFFGDYLEVLKTQKCCDKKTMKSLLSTVSRRESPQKVKNTDKNKKSPREKSPYMNHFITEEDISPIIIKKTEKALEIGNSMSENFIILQKPRSFKSNSKVNSINNGLNDMDSRERFSKATVSNLSESQMNRNEKDLNTLFTDFEPLDHYHLNQNLTMDYENSILHSEIKDAEKLIEEEEDTPEIDNDIIVMKHSETFQEDLFSWPEFLEKDIDMNFSLIVEMSFVSKDISDNWTLTDNVIINDSDLVLNESIQLEWDERLDRLHYDPIKKNFSCDTNGSVLLYCCRQVIADEEDMEQ